MSLYTLLLNTHGRQFVSFLSQYTSEKLWVDNEEYCGFLLLVSVTSPIGEGVSDEMS